jgi:CDP-4-dehydro-6-deoxyglucose reductase
VTLLFSARTRADLYGAGLMEYWQARHRNFTFKPTLTQEAGPGLHGRIPTLLPDLFKDLSGFSVFVAGAPGFVSDCVAAARRLGAREALVHTEGYFGAAPAQVPPRSQLVA